MPSKPSPVAKRVSLAVVTVLLLVVLVIATQRDRTASSSPASPTPIAPSKVEDTSTVSVACIHTMIDAAQRGDVARYRECFTGDLLKQLDDRLAAKNAPAKPGETLKAAITGLKGIATDPVNALPGERADVTMDLIYADHNARQQVTLRRVGTDWKIESWTDPHRLRPDILYGTPVEGR